LHESSIADDIGKENSSKLAVLFLHNYPVRSFSTSGHFQLIKQSQKLEVILTSYNLNCAPTKMR
jgi:hypothetical protein